MKLKYCLLLCLIFSSCYNVKKIELAKELPSLGPEEPFVIALRNKGVLKTAKAFIEDAYILFHESDVAKKQKRTKVADLKLKYNGNEKQFVHLFIELEKTAKRLGGNYVLINKLVQRSDPSFKNQVDATLYNVKNNRANELMYRWSEKRNIEKRDYSTPADKTNRGLASGLTYNVRLVIATTGNTHYFEFLNEFVRKNNSCNYCTVLDLERENLKFDLIELYQRKIVQHGEKLNLGLIDILELEFQESLLDSLDNKLIQVDEMKNIQNIEEQIKVVNEQIIELKAYQEKVLYFVDK